MGEGEGEEEGGRGREGASLSDVLCRDGATPCRLCMLLDEMSRCWGHKAPVLSELPFTRAVP